MQGGKNDGTAEKKDGDGDDDDCKEKKMMLLKKNIVMMMIARRRRCPRSQLETCSGHSLSRETSGPRPPEPFATFERGEQFGEDLLLKIYANHVNVMHREDP